MISYVNPLLLDSRMRLLSALLQWCGLVLDPEKHKPADEWFSPKLEYL